MMIWDIQEGFNFSSCYASFSKSLKKSIKRKCLISDLDTQYINLRFDFWYMTPNESERMWRNDDVIWQFQMTFDSLGSILYLRTEKKQGHDMTTMKIEINPHACTS